MNYTYDAIIERDEDGYIVSFPQFPDAVTYGKTREQAARRAHEVLTMILCEYIEEEKPLPKQERVAEVLSVCAEVNGDTISRSRCMTMSEAAEQLGISQARVSQLASAGILQSVNYGRRKLVTIASVNERKAASRAKAKERESDLVFA